MGGLFGQSSAVSLARQSPGLLEEAQPRGSAAGVLELVPRSWAGASRS